MTSITDRRAFLTAGSAIAASSVLPRFARAADTKTPSGPPPVEVYAGAPTIDQVSISPDATQIGIIAERGDDKLLLHYTIADESLKSFDLGAGKVRGLFWGDNDHVVLTRSQTTALSGFAGNKHEFYLATAIHMKTLKTNTFFNNMDHFYNIVEGDMRRIKVDGQYRVTASNYRMEDPYPLWLYSFDLEHFSGHPMCEGSNDTEGFVLAPDGTVVAYSDFNDLHKEWTLYYNTAGPGESKRFRNIYSVKDPLNTPSLEGLGRDGKSVVIFIGKGEAKGEYHEISAEGILSPPLDKGASLSGDPLFHPTTWRLAGFSHHDDWFSYDYDDPLLKKLADAIPQVMAPGARTSIVDFAEDPRKMIVYAEGAGDAGTYYYIDFSTGNARQIATLYPDLPPEWISEKQAIDYKAADGLNIHAYLTLPPGRKDTKNLPLIVLPHGGPQARDLIDFDWQTQCLASRGYAVLQPNFRGSTGYGEAFVEAAYGEFGRKMQTDLSDGVRYLAAQGTIDPKRVAIMGASYGGYAALAGATLDPGIYRCAVAIAGVSDPKTFIDFVADNTDSRFSSSVMYWKQMMGDPKTYDEISPVHQAAKAACPVLLLHGTDDTVVPINQSQRMESALKAAGKTVTFITYKGQDHWETIGSTRIEMMKAALDFLQKYNPA